MIIETKFDFDDKVAYKVTIPMEVKKVCPKCNGRSHDELMIDCDECDNFGWIKDLENRTVEVKGYIKEIIFDEFERKDGDRIISYKVKQTEDIYSEFGSVVVPHRVQEKDLYRRD